MSGAETAESAVLGACLMNTRSAELAGELLRREDFSAPGRAMVFAAIQTVLLRCGEVDPTSVALELGESLSECGGLPYLNSLPLLCPSVTQIREYARAVKDRSIERQMGRIFEEVTSNGTRGRASLEALQERLYSLETPSVDSCTLAVGLERLWKEAENPTSSTCEWPWMELQMWTHGLRPGWLYYLAGEASHGKTAAALAVVESNARHGRRVLVNSLEMTVEQLSVRAAQRHGLSVDRFYAGKAQASDFEVLSKTIADDAWSRVQIESLPTIERLASAVRRYKPDLVVIDYLGLIDIGNESRTEGTSRNSHSLKWDIARRFNVPVLCLVQTSRDRTQRGRVATMDRLKDSSSIEQDGDCVLFCWRKRDDNEQLTSEGAFVVAKSRMGRTGSVRFVFDGVTQTFRVITSHLPTGGWNE